MHVILRLTECLLFSPLLFLSCSFTFLLSLTMSFKNFLYIFIICMDVHVAHTAHMEIREQLVGVSSLLPQRCQD